MSHELFYTSVPRGLKPGTKGFCTVAVTRGLPGLLADRLEALSAYRPLFPAGSPQAAQNPVSWAHWRVSISGQTYCVLSRVCFAGLAHKDVGAIIARGLRKPRCALHFAIAIEGALVIAVDRRVERRR